MSGEIGRGMVKRLGGNFSMSFPKRNLIEKLEKNYLKNLKINKKRFEKLLKN